MEQREVKRPCEFLKKIRFENCEMCADFEKCYAEQFKELEAKTDEN